MTAITNPTAAIVALTEGYVLQVGERSIACTSLKSLAEAVRKELDRGRVVQMPQRPPAGAVRAALTHPDVLPEQPARDPAAPAVAGLALAQIPQEERRHFYAIAGAWVTNKLPDKKSLAHNLATYCPSLDPHDAELALGEFVADYRSDGD
jgi:hypothetical protein